MRLLLSFLLPLCCLTAAGAAEPKPINVTVGEKFKIELETDLTTGCQWLLSKPLDENLLKIVGKPSYRRSPRNGGAQPSFEVLTFNAVRQGKTVIHLKYDQLWKKTGAAVRFTNIVVVISPPRAPRAQPAPSSPLPGGTR